MVKGEFVFNKIDATNVFLITKFLETAGESLTSFRYYSRRALSVVNNHLITVVVTKNEIPVGYGHLDKEQDDVWLGIAVSDSVKGKGMGNMIMEYLVFEGKKNNIPRILLTVDIDNTVAIALYQKFGFKKIISDSRIIKMQLFNNGC